MVHRPCKTCGSQLIFGGIACDKCGVVGALTVWGSILAICLVVGVIYSLNVLDFSSVVWCVFAGIPLGIPGAIAGAFLGPRIVAICRKYSIEKPKPYSVGLFFTPMVMGFVILFGYNCLVATIDDIASGTATSGAEQLVSNTLVSPSSARFVSTTILEKRGNSYLIHTVVDANNLLGVTIRKSYCVVVDVVPPSWTIRYNETFAVQECSRPPTDPEIIFVKLSNDWPVETGSQE
jgi:hypothetical protein